MNTIVILLLLAIAFLCYYLISKYILRSSYAKKYNLPQKVKLVQKPTVQWLDFVQLKHTNKDESEIATKLVPNDTNVYPLRVIRLQLWVDHTTFNSDELQEKDNQKDKIEFDILTNSGEKGAYESILRMPVVVTSFTPNKSRIDISMHIKDNVELMQDNILIVNKRGLQVCDKSTPSVIMIGVV